MFLPKRIKHHISLSDVLPSGATEAAKFSDDFWFWVDDSKGPDACWPWSGTSVTQNQDQKKKKYGTYAIKIRGTSKGLLAHKIALYLAKGLDAAGGELVFSTCGTDLCCNPNHLKVGTFTDLGAIRAQKGNPKKSPIGSKAKEIRAKAAEGMSAKDIAALYNVSPQSVRSVLTGTTFANQV